MSQAVCIAFAGSHRALPHAAQTAQLRQDAPGTATAADAQSNSAEMLSEGNVTLLQNFLLQSFHAQQIINRIAQLVTLLTTASVKSVSVLSGCSVQCFCGFLALHGIKSGVKAGLHPAVSFAATLQARAPVIVHTD